MGLDMYLIGKISLYGNENKENREKINKILKIDLVPNQVEFEVMYWRKANAIHDWFVKNVQEGDDSCGIYYLTDLTLRKLYDTVCNVLKDKSLVEELLPPTEGFFFGSQEVDEYYWQNLNDTEKGLRKILEDKKYERMEFYYHSSW